MKLQDLRAQVYELAQVSTTQQLKAKYEEIRLLDMRCKISWEKALGRVQAQQNELKNWLENPPDEYKELFAEIQSSSKEFEQKLEEARQLHQEVNTVADSLEELANEYQNEAEHLNQEVKASRQSAKQARLNWCYSQPKSEMNSSRT